METATRRTASNMRTLCRFSVLMALLMAASCSRADCVEQFCRADGSGVYSFDVALPDTLASYDFSVFTRDDSVRSRFVDGVTQMRTVVSWIAPEGPVMLRDTVYIPSGTSRGTLSPYRAGVSGKIGREFTLEFRASEEPKRFRGIGLVFKKQNGTR